MTLADTNDLLRGMTHEQARTILRKNRPTYEAVARDVLGVVGGPYAMRKIAEGLLALDVLSEDEDDQEGDHGGD